MTSRRDAPIWWSKLVILYSDCSLQTTSLCLLSGGEVRGVWLGLPLVWNVLFIIYVGWEDCGHQPPSKQKYQVTPRQDIDTGYWISSYPSPRQLQIPTEILKSPIWSQDQIVQTCGAPACQARPSGWGRWRGSAGGGCGWTRSRPPADIWCVEATPAHSRPGWG